MPKLAEQPAAQVVHSGKLFVCARLLDAILLSSADRVVVVASRVEVLALIRKSVERLLDSTERWWRVSSAV